MNKSSKNKYFFAIILALIGIVSRFVPHLPNMTPMTAVTFIGSRYVDKKLAFAIPIVAMFVSDLIIGFYSIGVLVSVYISFALIGGIAYLNSRYSYLRMSAGVLGSSILFFVITNFAVWWWTPLYTHNISGFIASYAMALPFLGSMMVGDMAYTTGFVAVIEALRRLSAKHYQDLRIYKKAVFGMLQ